MTDLFSTVLNMSITASYVALAVIIIRILFNKFPKSFAYVLWLPVLIRLVFPFSFSSAFSFLNFLGLNSQTGTGTMEYVPKNLGLMQNPAISVGINRINNAADTSFPAATPTASVNPLQIGMEIASIIWIVGIAILLVYSIISYLNVINNVKTATRIKNNIYETDRITTPFVCGFIKPKIFIPTGISEKELTYILAHEQTHIKRFDYLVKPFAFLVLILHWFNPLMWLSFALMNKDMEMSCDERVIKEIGNDIKGSYAHSLLSLSVKRTNLIAGSPLAFGESNIKARIKNILVYKKSGFWVVVVAILTTVTLVVTLTTNPQKEQEAVPVTYSTYDIEVLIANKTSYVGNNSKVVALIDAMPLPEGIIRDTVELQTGNPPYGITINLIMNDASTITTKGAISGEAFYPNSILLFSLIDNVDIINYNILDNTGKYDGASYGFTFTRESIEKLLGEDLRSYATDAEALENLIDKLNNMSFTITPLARNEQIEKYLEIIMSSPLQSSRPGDYIAAHQDEYKNILKMGDQALDYLIAQFDNRSNNNDLRGHIMMALAKELLGERNNVTDEWLSPQEWFSQLSLYE